MKNLKLFKKKSMEGYFEKYRLPTMYVLVLRLFVFSCVKTPPEFSNEKNTGKGIEGVSNIDGMLIFKDNYTFENIKKSLISKEMSFKEFARLFPNFTSSWAAYVDYSENKSQNFDINNTVLPVYLTKVYGENGDVYIKPFVDFQELRIIANENCMYQIGNTVYEFTYDAVLTTDKENANHLLTFTNGSSDPKITVLPIDRKMVSQESGVVEERVVQHECEKEYTPSGGNKRMFELSILSRIYPGYSRYSVDLDHFRRNLGAWWLNDVTSMSFSGTIAHGCCSASSGSCKVCCPTTGGNACVVSGSCTGSAVCRYSVGGAVTNEAEVFDVLFENNGGGHFSYPLTPTNISFTGIGDDNKSYTCSIIL